VSGADKAKNKVQNLVGKAKEAVGKVTGDKSTENEGKAEQAKANLKYAGEKVKDAFKNYVPRHRGKAGDGPASTGDGPASTGDGPRHAL
jgi:uncharacterized protein YjbJ (UPF0337 family)